MNKHKKILMVDDDADDRELMNEAMISIEAAGIMQFAENGVEALKSLEADFEQQNLPSLVVLDLNMPKMNGIQTLEQIKADDRFKDMIVVIFSTSINPIERKTCMDLGAHIYINKPVSLAESIEIGKSFLLMS